jgi:phosphatidylserine decarboxylase
VSLDVLLSSLVLALVFIPGLAWKWRVSIKVAFAAAVVIGALTGWIVNRLDAAMASVDMPELVLAEGLLIVTFTLLGIAFRFYRDPERYPAETSNVILSPADGKVIYVNRVDAGSSLVSTKGSRTFRLDEIMDTDLVADAAYLVGIEMNILNVHVNRSPIAGRTILRKRVKGTFMSLGRPESEVLNERVTTVFSNDIVKIGVVQIASRLVRRIVSYVREGDTVAVGQRIGAIVFGSQVDVAIPKTEGLSIDVRPGDAVKAGISVIARYSTDLRP